MSTPAVSSMEATLNGESSMVYKSRGRGLEANRPRACDISALAGIEKLGILLVTLGCLYQAMGII